MIVVVLSGAIAVGKSTLAKNLVRRGAIHVSTRQYLLERCGTTTPTREELQAKGKQLDEEDPEWFIKLCSKSARFQSANILVLDSARRLSQIEMLRAKFGQTAVLHVHLEAERDDLRQRYANRGENSTYEGVKRDTLERSISDLALEADIVINTSAETPEDTFTRVASRLFIPSVYRNVDVLVGGQYGSEGKGHIVAHLAPEYDCLVRVGGPNAGHSVLFDGHHVSFYHLPSGNLHAPQAKLVFGAAMNIRIPVLMAEIEKAEKLGVGIRHRLFIDGNANVITDEDIEYEGGLVKSIGSTGQGVGAATAAKITGRGFGRMLAKDYEELAPFIHDAQDVLNSANCNNDKILLEGTQGTGLSLFHGPYPHVTSRDTAVSGTLGDAGIPAGRVRKVVMVVRTNPIRVQSPQDASSGPMSKELSWEDVAARSGVPADELRARERTTTTKRLRRISEFDWALLARSAQLNLPTDIALTFADYISPLNMSARRFDQLTEETRALIQEIEQVARCPVSMVTTRLHERSILDRRQGW